ncbi:hypothetical protein MTO96_018025 [Rhipicephalus appendiculatus]
MQKARISDGDVWSGANRPQIEYKCRKSCTPTGASASLGALCLRRRYRQDGRQTDSKSRAGVAAIFRRQLSGCYEISEVTFQWIFRNSQGPAVETCLLENDVETNCTESSYLVAVLRSPTVLQQSFPYLIGIIVSINYISMGCQIDVNLIITTLKKPLAPLLGIACQFLFMPLVSYGIGLVLLENALMRFGIFMLGCSPGGNSSNLWTLIFNGDVALSVTMTFVSTIVSIGMMPLWVFLLGRHMSPETGVLSIPFSNIIASLVGLAIPLGIGMAIHKLKPTWALALTKYIKPVTIIVLLAILVLSVTVNQYIFMLMTWQALLCGALVSWSAYVFGALAAFNSGIAIVILYTSLPLPDADLVIVPVVCQTILQGVPLYVLYIAKRIKSCVSKRLHPEEKQVPGSISSEPEVESGLCPAKAACEEARECVMPSKDALELRDMFTDGEVKKSRL